MNTREPSFTAGRPAFWLFTFLWFAALLFGPLHSALATTVSLRDGFQHYPLVQQLDYIEDKGGLLTLDDILSDTFTGQFVRSRTDIPNFGFTQSAYWFRVNLSNVDSANNDWLLEIQYAPLDLIEAYVTHKGGRMTVFRSGDTLPFSKRAVKHRHPMFNVPLARGESATIYLRVKTESSLQLPAVLWSPRALLAKDHEEQYWLGIYYGIIVAMFFYNLMIFLSIRDLNYLYYLYYLFSWGFFQISLNGLAFEYLWPGSPWWANITIPLFIGSTFNSIIQFSRAFLQLKQTVPQGDLMLRVHFWTFMFIMIAAFFVPYSLVVKVATFGALSGATIVLGSAILCLKRGVLQAKYFLIAWTLLLLGIILYVLKSFGGLPNMFITEYGLQIGSALEVVLLSFALAHKMRILKEENERIQRESTQLLEQYVQQRTEDLNQALRDLYAANEKLKATSHVDGLTGVKNRAYFEEQYALEWQRAFHNRSSLGLLIIDIDHFKNINDTYGHLCGDACLKQIAGAIKGALHRRGDELFRYGGEEFVAILPNTSLEGSTHMATSICKLIERLDIRYEGIRIFVTISIGIACTAPDSDTDEDRSLISAADHALYQAKHNGRNQVCVFTPTDLNAAANV